MSSAAAFIPFITGREHCDLIEDLYPDAQLARVALHDIDTLKDYLPSNLWVDAGIDGLDDLDRTVPKSENGNDHRQAWSRKIKTFPGYEKIGNLTFQQSPKNAVVEQFVDFVLNACLEYSPSAVSVPQLPHVNDTSRNRINKSLATAAAKWQLKHGKVSLILPIILNHSTHSASKTARNPHVKLASQCLLVSKAKACWIVDASFNDEDQSADMRRKRIQGLVSFHQEFNAATSEVQCRRIGGPYWALNLLLWSRGLIDQFGIGIGTGYRYFLSGGYPNTATRRIAIPPLFRRAEVGPKLLTWIDATLKSIDASHPFREPLAKLRPISNAVPKIQAKRQTAAFYRSWIDSLQEAPPLGRAMALFQSLSIAFSRGRQLISVMDGEGTTRRPESIAEPLMLNCV